MNDKYSVRLDIFVSKGIISEESSSAHKEYKIEVYAPLDCLSLVATLIAKSEAVIDEIIRRDVEANKEDE